MRKLTIEEKAQRYDKAIERARYWEKNPTVWSSDDICQKLFPELKESEDEKIRKALIRFHKSTIDVDGIKGEDIIAWLEKQGEPVEINPTEFDTRLQTLIGKFDSLPKEELIGSLSFWLNVVQNNGTYKPAKKQGKQKSAKNIVETWKDMRLEVYQQASGNRHESNCSDDTTKMFSLNDIDEIIEKMSEQKPVIEGTFVNVDEVREDFMQEITYFIPKGFHAEIDDDKVVIKKGEKSAEWSEEDEKNSLDIKCLIGSYRAGDTEYRLDSWIDSLKNRVQPKQEWSEEDEVAVKDICDKLNRLSMTYVGKESIVCQEDIKWLKSLRHHNQWKPSKEQMKALNYVVNLMASSASPKQNDYYYNVFKNLRKQIKKLMEDKE